MKFVRTLLFGAVVAGSSLSLAYAAPSVTVTPNTSSVGRYNIYELALTNTASYANPWEDVTVSAVFTAPSGKTYTVGGFYYDTNTWRVRFAPTETGSFNWTLSFATSAGTFLSSGSFTSTPSSNTGFVRLHPTYTQRLLTEGDGRIFYPNGQETNASDWTDVNGTGAADGLLDWCMAYQPAGFDQWQCTLTSADQYWNDAFVTPKLNIARRNGEDYNEVAQFNINGTGKNTYRADFGKLLDQLVSTAHKAGIKYQWAFMAFPNQLVPNFDISNSAARQALLKVHQYVINRYGAYVDIWELMNENGSPSLSPIPQAYYDTVTQYVRGNDPYQHIITTSSPPPVPHALIETNSAHLYFDTPSIDLDDQFVNGTYGTRALLAALPNKPNLWGEMGNRCGSFGSTAADAAEERYRILIWTGFFNNTGIIFWPSTDSRLGACPGGLTNMFIGPAQRAHSAVFANQLFDFDPAATILQATLSAPPGQSIRGYFLGSNQDLGGYILHSNSHTSTLSGAKVTLTVPASGLTGQWINPVNGAVVQFFSPASGNQTLTIPDFSTDIALRIRPSAAPLPVTVTVSPKTKPRVGPGQTLAFAAAVTGTANTAVTWSLSPSIGTISSAGVYTPPSSVSSVQIITVKATSQADNSAFDQTTLSLVAAAPPKH